MLQSLKKTMVNRVLFIVFSYYLYKKQYLFIYLSSIGVFFMIVMIYLIFFCGFVLPSGSFFTMSLIFKWVCYFYLCCDRIDLFHQVGACAIYIFLFGPLLEGEPTRFLMLIVTYYFGEAQSNCETLSSRSMGISPNQRKLVKLLSLSLSIPFEGSWCKSSASLRTVLVQSWGSCTCP